MIFENGKTFHLKGKNISYIIYVNVNGELKHYYYGKTIPDRDYGKTAIENSTFFHEYPDFGRGDLRTPAYTVVNSEGNAISSLKYKSHRIYDGKYSVDGMPALYEGDCKAMTLEVTLTDEIAGFDTILYYAVYDEYDIVTRSVKIINLSNSDITVTGAMSANLELPIGEYETIHFAGAWGRERYIKRMNIEASALVELSNTEGTCAHRLTPFVIICQKGADETHGEVYGMSLIYSTDYAATIFMDEENRVRASMGVNPHTFEEKLLPNKEFMTPECVMNYSPDGFERLSQTYHEVYNSNLSISKWVNKDRPVVFNSWEGTYGKFTEEDILVQARKASEMGVELFVLDDGWYGRSCEGIPPLGDWFVNEDKLPDGIDGLAKKINDMGMEFGLWFEPEALVPHSELYKSHPEWIIQVPDREPTLWFHRYLLDLTRDDVQQYIIESVSKFLRTANITYIKWDMNRSMTDRVYPGYAHKYVLGLYNVMDALVKEFPDVLFEGCAGGGGRYDAGILAYMPQIWTSDDSDAVERMKIQYATSFVYPMSSMSAHVSTVPNHQSGRTTSLGLRTAVAGTGSFGYELDLTKVSEEELIQMKEDIKVYKENRNLFRTGTFYRLENPFNGIRCAWQTVSKDKLKSIVMVANLLHTVNLDSKWLKLRGLDENTLYTRTETEEKFYGAELMNRGLEIDLGKDFSYQTVTLIAER